MSNYNETTRDAACSASWFEDWNIHVEDSIRSKELSTKTRKPVITAQVVNISCECGGSCENASGSTMIDETDKVATCPDCGNTYEVPAKVFDKKLA